MAFRTIPGLGLEPISIGWARVLTERSATSISFKRCVTLLRSALGLDPKRFVHAERKSGTGTVGDTELAPYAAPAPFRTAGTVFANIFKSSQSDHSSMYCRSRSIH